jgi:bifunctional DNA-binding transcriptional regulator/antitoxin component of YhaV-PrlF toxin-antitoxin module
LFLGEIINEITKNTKYLGKYTNCGDYLEFIKIDQTGKIYLPKIIRDRIDTKCKYLIITLPDGDVILHKIKKSKNPLREFQRLWSSTKDISQIRKEISDEAEKLAGKRGD